MTEEESTKEMEKEIAAMDDQTLLKEWTFAEIADVPGPEATTWLYLLRIEKKARDL